MNTASTTTTSDNPLRAALEASDNYIRAWERILMSTNDPIHFAIVQALYNQRTWLCAQLAANNVSSSAAAPPPPAVGSTSAPPAAAAAASASTNGTFRAGFPRAAGGGVPAIHLQQAGLVGIGAAAQIAANQVAARGGAAAGEAKMAPAPPKKKKKMGRPRNVVPDGPPPFGFHQTDSGDCPSCVPVWYKKSKFCRKHEHLYDKYVNGIGIGK